jgi:hypothetical protein
VSRGEPMRAWQRLIVRFDVRKPSSAEQKELWQNALGEEFHRLNGQVENVVAQFNLGPSGIQAACAESGLVSSDEKNPGAKLWEACRVQSRTRLDDLAQRIQPAATWEDLVVPEAQRQILREIATHLRQRTKVYEVWGFATKGERGLGISALFAGGSGTGKTMAAEVLANELCLDLYRIDLSSVVSKYIGETEKNLRRVFDAAEEGGAILLFDEADALFGKRSEVKDSHDRYANIEVKLFAPAHGSLSRAGHLRLICRSRSTRRSCAAFGSSCNSHFRMLPTVLKSGGAFSRPAHRPNSLIC